MGNIRWISTTKDKPWQELEASTCQKGDVIALTDKTAQTMSGFGGCFNELGYIALQKMDEATQKKILDDFFLDADGCNFNYCRLPIGANDYAAKWYSHSEVEGDYNMEHHSIERDQKYLLPYIREGLKRKPDMKLFASPWSPPTWMKFPQAHNYGTMIWNDEILKAYALYFKKFVEAYDAEGIKIHQVHVQNEPVSSQKFPSCVWTGEELREFIADYLGPLFKENDIDTDIWLGTINGPETDERYIHTRYNDYANIVLSDPNARQFVKGVSYQWAGKYAVQRTHMAWPDMELIQSENECGEGLNTWEYARYVFDLIWHYIANGVTGYIYWNFALEPGGNSTWGWNQNAMITLDAEKQEVIYNPEYYLMKHVSSFIQKGAKRIEIEGSWVVNTLAFKNPDGSTVIVIHNPFFEEKTVSTKVEGKWVSLDLPADSFNTVVV